LVVEAYAGLDHVKEVIGNNRGDRMDADRLFGCTYSAHLVIAYVFALYESFGTDW
jgi:hypothetical protein